MKKTTLSLLLALTLLLTLAVPACSAGAVFSDVPETAWYAESVQYVQEQGIMTGVDDGRFDPDGTVTRATVWTVLARLEGVDTTAPTGWPWYQAARDWAMENGVSDGENPNGAVTREQLATMLYRYHGSPAVTAGEDFADQETISAWAVEGVRWAKEKGIVNGVGDGRFDPRGNANRAQLATMVKNYKTIVVASEQEKPQPSEGPTPAPSGRPSGGGSSGGTAAPKPTPTPTPTPTPVPDPEPVPDPGPTPVDPGPDSDPKVLVAYFSATNNTKGIAEKVAQATGGDLFAIEPQTPYTSADLDYTDSTSRSQVEQNDSGARPAIVSTVANLSEYDVIFLGYPIWNGKAPKVIYTFLESCGDWSGKTVVPFCTSGSSPIGSSATNLHSLISGEADWLSGNRFSSGASQETITAWVDGLNLNLDPSEEEVSMSKLTISFGEHTYSATLEESATAVAFAELLQSKGGSMTIHMSEYGGWEKVGSLGQTLPSNNTQTTTVAGDFVLYSGNQIVLFYGSNSWSYTRLGRLDDPAGLRDALGSGDWDVTFALAK